MATNMEAPGFVALRVTHEFTQINHASPQRVFPLLCPVLEAKWVPGWKYRLIYSQSGVAETDCVFTTPEEDAAETVWQCTAYHPQRFHLEYVWVRPGVMTAHLRIQLAPRAEEQTDAHISYTYTSLSEAGNRELARMDESWFQQKMNGWQSAINHYLRTGELIKGEGWE